MAFAVAKAGWVSRGVARALLGAAVASHRQAGDPSASELRFQPEDHANVTIPYVICRAPGSSFVVIDTTLAARLDCRPACMSPALARSQEDASE